MHWSKFAGRYRPFLVMIMMVVTPTTGFPPPTSEPTTWPPEPNCIEGTGNTSVCACDPQCARYGDCCRSSQYFVPEEQRLGASPFKCTTLSKISLYAIMTCPPDWTDSYTRNRCENPDTSYSDPLLDAPVTSTSTNITYRNWHCAYCHRDLDANTTGIWAAKILCHIERGMPSFFVSEDTIMKYLSYDTHTSQWNFDIDKHDLETDPGIRILIEPQIEQRYKYKCDLLFIPEPNELKTARFCRTDIIAECSTNWKGTEEHRQCNAYTAHICSGRKTYRNHHCFLCNNFTTLQQCGTYAEYPTAPTLEYGPPFSALLNWKRLKRRTCASSEIYDPLARVCRKVYV
ncbi:uncharacterized protein LOC111872936 [Cryptotermes secundus]|uniref:uncharacterized protein LOC111872936 n=1 Tax=Cryptotermes secundus TaxID=105785 RepID=UPI000CD7B3F8|nr:uncharacterized protein LOC111872936 [Cryptotermes secundus]